MKFSTAAVAAAIFGFAAATPVDRRAIIDLGDGIKLIPREPRALQRRANRRTNPIIASPNLSNISNVEYSSNWAGVAVTASNFKTVTGTFTVPTPKVPSGGSSSRVYAASAWVGIDGFECETGIIQTGVDFEVQGSATAFDAWYEFYPDYAYTFSGISIAAGNSITVTATATSSTAGSVTVLNSSTGKSVTHTWTTAPSGGSLCRTDAEWIVEDFESNGSLVPFANFGTVTFTGATATTASGTVYNPSQGTIIDIEQSGTILTSCSDTSSTVKCTYV